MTSSILSDVAYRAMREADLDAVIAIEQAICEVPWTRGNFQDCLASDYSCQILCYQGKHVGHSVLSAAVGEAHLLNISVRSDYQGLGLGRILLRHMLGNAVELGAKTAFLEVRQSNRVAQALYQSEGFNEVGRRLNYYPARDGREDAIIMAMEL